MSHLPRVHIEEMAEPVAAPTVARLSTTVARDATRIIVEEPPLLEKDVVVVHPEVLREEHHIQPVIHETERHVQPIVKTRVTTEHPVTHREVVINEPAGAPVVAPLANLTVARSSTTVARDATRVIVEEPPLMEKDVVVVHPEVLREEHHIQPIIHETERHVQPIVKTRVTTEHPVTYREVVINEPAGAPVVAPVAKPTAARSSATVIRDSSMVIVEDPPVLEKRIVHEHPQVIHHEHHIQPIIRETERHIEPIHQTEITTEHPITQREVVVKGPPLVAKQHVVNVKEAGTTTSPTHATLGQKLRGSMTHFMGTLTGNEAKKEKGRLLKRGVDPASVPTVTQTYEQPF